MTVDDAVRRPPPSLGDKWITCNGQQLRKMANAGLTLLERNHQKVNDLNVFPVPDGDTGTNMLLTMRAAYKRIQDSQDNHVGLVAYELSYGALMGARGNSGVILSQIWRGLARGLKDKRTFNAQELAVAMQLASETAYKGVMRPVEGTILTVIREAAVEAQDAARKSSDLRFLLERVVERCQQVLAQTPEMLPVLKQAGVVDAGGQGLLYILEGMLRYVYGELFDVVELPVAPQVPAQALAAPAEGLEYPYDVQFILMGEKLDIMAVRSAIDAMGDSTVVVGDDQTIKVHVHVKDPGIPLSYGASQGKLQDVVVENMQIQMEAIIGTTAEAGEARFEPAVALQEGQIGVVAVAAGSGLARIFRSLGASGIVNGGQSNNPSTEEIYRAVEAVPTDRIIILPNNKNIVLAAEAVKDLSHKQIAVVPTGTVPQGVSALLSLDRDGPLKETAASMEEASKQVTSGEITVATRSVLLDDVNVAQGQIVGLVDGRLCASDSDISEVLRQVLKAMNAEDRELVSIYYGQDVSASDAQLLASRIAALYPHLEIELLEGGQAIYQYILGAE